MGYSLKKLSTVIKGRRRLRLVLLFLFAFCILVISIIFFTSSLTKSYMGMTLTLQNEKWEVSTLEPNGLATHAGIEVGDEPIEINGQPAQIFLETYKEHGMVLGILFSELTVIDDNGELTVVVLKDHPPTWQTNVELIIWFFVCIVFWITGFYVFLKKPNNQPAIILCFCGVIFGLAISGQLAAERAIYPALWLGISASIVGPWLLFHFFIVLPDEQEKLRNNPLVYFVYFPAVITLIFFYIVGYADGQPLPGFRNIRLFVYFLGFMAAAIMVIYNFMRASSIRTRQQMKIVLISCLMAIIPFLILLPLSVFEREQTPSGFNLMFFAFIPLGLGYAVIKEKLLDIDMVIRRGLIYTLITIKMAIILACAIFIVVISKESLNIYEEVVIALALGALATILFGPSKRIVETFIDKFFYKDRYDYRQIIQSLSTALKLHNDSTSISRLIVGASSNTLNLAGACLFVITQSGSLELRASQGTFSNANKQNQLRNLIYQSNSSIIFPNSVSGIDLETAFLIPLVSEESEVGFLCLSPKNTGQNFSSSDLYLIQGLASVASIALLSVRLVRDVSVRDTFVSIASHELRTPMSSIRGYTELLLQRDPPRETRKQWLQNILYNSIFISEMVDDLLNVTRIQAGKIAMKIEKVDIPNLINTRVDVLKETHNIHEFKIDIEAGLPKASVDPDKFGQIINNLLDNAAKYSPDGGRITISSYLGKTKKRIVVSVADEGIGISSEDRDSLFTTFHRIQRPETQGIRGSGLGLYIVKEWTEAMNGEIWLESELNKGSTFYVAVPVADTETIV